MTDTKKIEKDELYRIDIWKALRKLFALMNNFMHARSHKSTVELYGPLILHLFTFLFESHGLCCNVIISINKVILNITQFILIDLILKICDIIVYKA